MFVYYFGNLTNSDKHFHQSKASSSLLGGKGANLVEMAALGLPVPPGFTISTDVCAYYYANNKELPKELYEEVLNSLELLGKSTGRLFGDIENPLLVSVRSGAPISMPGMMDTVLNLGLNDQTVEGLAKLTGNKKFALDCYRRFLSMYSSVVLGISSSYFDDLLEDLKEKKSVYSDSDLDVEDLEKLILSYKKTIKELSGNLFPEDVYEQLWGAVKAVFGSWNSDRAIFYRKMHDVPDSLGTAVTIQAMVFGNIGDQSATGVAFTRNPSTGEKKIYGEFLVNAQGEDVVAGIRTPQSLTKAARLELNDRKLSMEECFPDVFNNFTKVVTVLEGHFKDIQDIEFTVENGILYLLQTRNAKRTAKASIKSAVDMAEEGLISHKEAILRIDQSQFEQLLHPMLDPLSLKNLIAKGLPASPGAASGRVVFSSEEAVRLSSTGEDVILIRGETSPEDIHGMHAAKAIVTVRGGMTSHAAVVARGMGRPCISGTTEINLYVERGEFLTRGVIVKAGDIISVDGTSGEIYLGAIKMIEPEFSDEFYKIMKWSKEHKKLGVRANADTVLDAKMALKFGADGIGLCRTEHMFFDDDRITAVREMILADDEAGRRKALQKIIPMQKSDFIELFKIMKGFPVTIRLLDPPLHEFLPHSDDDIMLIVNQTGIDAEKLRKKTKELVETNPMLGWRGCRLAVSCPEIYEGQIWAILEAAIELNNQNHSVDLEIMHPLVSSEAEMNYLSDLTHRVAEQVFSKTGQRVDYRIGTMIELPKAAICADKLALTSQFFSFGTNDLTQTTLGISRDDAGRFLNTYIEKGLIKFDPFVQLDMDGVGYLIREACLKGRAVRPDIKLGICGEHGGDPTTISFCHEISLDYVSCSPYRVPMALLAAAQAALRD